MKLTPGHIASELAGTLGSITVHRGPHGHVAHTRPRLGGPPNPGYFTNGSAAAFLREQRRTHFSLAVSTWHDLTDDERSAWSSYAQHRTTTGTRGHAIPATGYNAFISQALIQLPITGDLDTTPPTGGHAPLLESLSLTATSSPATFALTFTPNPGPPHCPLVIAVAFFTSPQTHTPPAGWKGTLTFPAESPSPLDIAPYLTDLLPICFPGTHVGVRLQFYSTPARRLSQPLIARTTVT